MIAVEPRRLLRKAAGAAYWATRWRLLTDRERAIEEWKRSGQEPLRLEYDLDERSVVVDAGGYAGQWASDIVARFLCRVHVYEPVPEFAARIRERFAKNPLVTVHQVGLGAETRDATIHVRGAASSLRGDGDSRLQRRVRIVRAADAFEEAGLESIDLLKLNIEGAEYEVLPHLIESGWVARIRHLQVQFHELDPSWRERAADLRRRLSETHDLVWGREHVWESWRRRGR